MWLPNAYPTMLLQAIHFWLESPFKNILLQISRNMVWPPFLDSSKTQQYPFVTQNWTQLL
jgi:hypothetical protein